MFEAGIVDPTKVTRNALLNAASISALFITTEAAVAELPEKNAPAAPAMPDGGSTKPKFSILTLCFKGRQHNPPVLSAFCFSA